MSQIFDYDKIVVRQKAFSFGAFYEFYNMEDRTLIGTIKEKVTFHTILNWIPYFTDINGFVLELLDLQGNVVQTYKRNMGINPSIKTYDENNKLISIYKAKYISLTPNIKITDDKKQEVGTLRGNVFGTKMGIVSPSGNAYCKIDRPVFSELLSIKYSQVYNIEFTEGLNLETKQKIFGMIPSLDQFYHEA